MYFDYVVIFFMHYFISFYELHYFNLFLLGDLRRKRLHQLRNNSTGKYNMLIGRKRERERER